MPCNLGSIIGFGRCEAGAVSVDWVVLSASIVGIGLAAVVSVKTGAVQMGAEVSYSMRAATITGLGGNSLAAVAEQAAPASAANSDCAPLVATPEEFEILVQHLAETNDSATLATSYADYATQTAEMLTSGETEAVPGFIDAVAAIAAALDRTGGAVPPDAPSLDALCASYDQSTS